MTDSNTENAQRLGDVILPRMLGDLVKHNDKILNARELLKQQKVNPNSVQMRDYKKLLPKQLTAVQFQWCVGVMLGDGSMQVNNNLTTYRLKMQQVEKNLAHLKETIEILKPYTISEESKMTTRKSMYEMQTISHEAFVDLANLFQKVNEAPKPNKNVQKEIRPEILEHLSIVAVAAWFSGDGGKRDYGKNQGKAVQFHTQGFKKNECEILAQGLRENFKWDARVIHDGVNKQNVNTYLIQVEASSFDRLYSELSPYLSQRFLEKLPSPRKPNSRFREQK